MVRCILECVILSHRVVGITNTLIYKAQAIIAIPTNSSFLLKFVKIRAKPIKT